MTGGYKAREFAALSGVTVRALHHYDRLGLLRPKRTLNGYRTYGEQDLVRLEQIVALKFIGLPLRRIKELLDREGLGLAGALEFQRRVLEAKRGLLDQAIAAIGKAEAAVMEMQDMVAGVAGAGQPGVEGTDSRCGGGAGGRSGGRDGAGAGSTLDGADHGVHGR